MIWVYAVALGVGVLALIVVIFGSVFASNVGRDDRDPNQRLGKTGKLALGGLLGFGMGGVAAWYSPMDLNQWVVLALALVAAVGAMFWVRFSVDRSAG